MGTSLGIEVECLTDVTAGMQGILIVLKQAINPNLLTQKI